MWLSPGLRAGSEGAFTQMMKCYTAVRVGVSNALAHGFQECDEKKQLSEGHLECASVFKILKYAKSLEIISLVISNGISLI